MLKCFERIYESYESFYVLVRNPPAALSQLTFSGNHLCEDIETWPDLILSLTFEYFSFKAAFQPYQIIWMTRVHWWIVNDDEATLDFDPVDENHLWFVRLSINLKKNENCWIHLREECAFELAGLKTHLVELDENYLATQCFVPGDPHLWLIFLKIMSWGNWKASK